MSKRKDDSHEFKPLLVEIEERPPNPLGRFIFWTIIAAIVFFVLWAFIGQVDVVVTARGKVIPVGEVKTIQPLNTGVIRKILITAGDSVQKGDILMEIDPSDIEPELESMSANLEQLDLEMTMRKALLAERPFQPDPKRFAPALVTVQKQIFHSTLDGRRKYIDVKNQELKQLAEQIIATEKTNEQDNFRLNIASKRLKRLANVRDVISKDEYEKAEMEKYSYENSISVAENKLEELEAGKKRILQEIEVFKEEEKSRILVEYSASQKEYTSLKGRINKAAYFNSRQQIISPVNGHVSQLHVHTIGGVVTPAEKLCSIVPANSPMEVKAQALNKDIGFVTTSMDVSIKIDAYSFQKYGTLNGVVRQVSKDSIEDPNLGDVYEVYVTPHETSLIVEGVETEINTGMTVTAEINVGKRRIIEFFIYPIIKYLDEGMSVL